MFRVCVLCKISAHSALNFGCARPRDDDESRMSRLLRTSPTTTPHEARLHQPLLRPQNGAEPPPAPDALMPPTPVDPWANLARGWGRTQNRPDGWSTTMCSIACGTQRSTQRGEITLRQPNSHRGVRVVTSKSHIGVRSSRTAAPNMEKSPSRWT